MRRLMLVNLVVFSAPIHCLYTLFCIKDAKPVWAQLWLSDMFTQSDIKHATLENRVKLGQNRYNVEVVSFLVKQPNQLCIIKLN